MRHQSREVWPSGVNMRDPPARCRAGLGIRVTSMLGLIFLMALRHGKGGDAVAVIRVQCAGAVGGAGVEWVLWWVAWVVVGGN